MRRKAQNSAKIKDFRDINGNNGFIPKVLGKTVNQKLTKMSEEEIREVHSTHKRQKTDNDDYLE